jgi:hypothetical protein
VTGPGGSDDGHMNTTSTSSTTRTSRKGRTLGRSFAGVLAAGVLAITATACQPPSCEQDCVSSVAIDQGSAKTRVVTTVPTKAAIWIYQDSTRKQTVVNKASSTFATDHTISHQGLTPNKDYWYTVKATDEAGKTWTEQGSFRTYKRSLTFKITRINLIDDSDSLGSGEIRFGMRAGGQDFGKVYENLSMSSGTDLKNLSITRSIANTAPATFRIDIQGIDDDCEGIGSLCTGGTGFDYQTGGSNSDADWASASTGTITAPTSNTTGNWSVTTTSYALKFAVYGTWTVAYAA